MIITSNSVNHEYTIPSLSIIGEVDGLSKVAYKATVYLNSSITFEHTYETIIYDSESLNGITTSITENKTVTNFTYCNIDLSTKNLDPVSFTPWEDLQEEQVLQWCFDTNPELFNIIQSENEEKVLRKQDEILNPLKYFYDNPPTPWKIREDQESTINT